ncbi:MAG: hypothetical protein EXX96DRAFT_459233, partial [Benjaminiella poitrasii]
SIYEGAKLYVAYNNNIKMHFGNRLRQSVNVLLNVHERKRQLQEQLMEQGENQTEKQMGEAIFQQITQPYIQLKKVIELQHVTVHALQRQSPGLIDTVNALKSILTSYNQGYTFWSSSIYYDCKARSEQHLKAFFCLAQL